MLITSDQEIAGLPAVRVRDLMRAIREHDASPDAIAELLGVPWTDGRALIERLAREGLLCRVEPTAGGSPLAEEGTTPRGGGAAEYWRTTIAGNALSKARLGKPMPRPKAQQLLDAVIVRAVAINADPDSLFTIERIDVFGSFADTTSEHVGDVDLHVRFDRRVDGDTFIERSLEAVAEAEAAGRRFRNHLDRLSFLELEFRRHLRGGSQRIDVQFDAVDHVARLPEGATTRVVYQRPANP